MNQLETARQAIAQEIRRLAAEQANLEKVLLQLGGAGRASVKASPLKVDLADAAPRKRGRPRKNPDLSTQASESDVNAAVGLIQEAGKKGVKAIALAYKIKNAGHTKPEKQQLIDTGKVKMTGKGGASTYVYIG